MEETWKEAVIAYVPFGYFPQGHEENQGTIQVGRCLGQDSSRSPPVHKSAASLLDATRLVSAEIELFCHNVLGLTFDSYVTVTLANTQKHFTSQVRRAPPFLCRGR